MLIVADSSALVALAVCDGLHLLERLFDKVTVPQAVFDEVIVKGKPEAETLRVYLTGKINRITLDDFVIAAEGFGQGELEAMALYKRLHADYLFVDDKRARKVALLNHIRITGSQGILLLAKDEGLILHVEPFIARLRASDIRISETLLRQTLLLAGEDQYLGGNTP